MVPAHSVPILSEGVLVGVALVLFDQEAAFDTPAVAGREIAARMDVGGLEGARGDPGLFGAFGNDLGVFVDGLPLFFTNHDMDGEVMAGIGSVVIANVIDPTKVLMTFAPVLLVLLVGP